MPRPKAEADLLALGLQEASFDAVVCVFGIFFVADMPAAVRALWRHVRPGGRLALTTWGPRVFEPLNTVFWRAIAACRPDLQRSFHPWDRITAPDAVQALLVEGGVPTASIEVVAEPGRHPLASPEDGWALVLGSGYRGTLDQLSAEDRERVREACTTYVRERSVRALEASVVYSLARKP